MKLRAIALIAQLIATFLITGCAIGQRADNRNSIYQPSWHGRLAMQVEAIPNEPQSHPQSFSAAFELIGTPETGELIFFTPLGSTAASIRWTPHLATLESQGETRTDTGLSPLIQSLLGTGVPVTALFAWLEGRDLPAEGWQVDLTQFTQGKIMAQRLTPPPQAQLRLVLEH